MSAQTLAAQGITAERPVVATHLLAFTRQRSAVRSRQRPPDETLARTAKRSHGKGSGRFRPPPGGHWGTPEGITSNCVLWPMCGPGSSARLEYPPVAQPHALGHRRWRSVLRGRRSDRRAPGASPRMPDVDLGSWRRTLPGGCDTRETRPRRGVRFGSDLVLDASDIDPRRQPNWSKHGDDPRYDRMAKRPRPDETTGNLTDSPTCMRAPGVAGFGS
jgi:hypothetical protein